MGLSTVAIGLLPTHDSIGYQLAAPVAGGSAPWIAAWLVHSFPGQPWLLALYIVGISILSLTCVLLLAETSRNDLTAASNMAPPAAEDAPQGVDTKDAGSATG
jgi:hypothetical protein